MTVIINTLPYNLTNGTLADASQVMANYNQIVNNVNSATTGAAGVNIANTFLQLNSFQVGLQAGGTSQFGLDNGGNLTTSSKITINSNVLTLAGSLYTNVFNADGSATLGGPWAFGVGCTFINPVAAQNPVTLTYANSTYAPIASPIFTGTVVIPTLQAASLQVSSGATFTGSISGAMAGLETVMLVTPVELVSSYTHNAWTSVSINSFAPNAKIAILKVYMSVTALSNFYLRQTGSGLTFSIGLEALQTTTAAVGLAMTALNNSQSFDYYDFATADSGSLWLVGYIQ